VALISLSKNDPMTSSILIFTYVVAMTSGRKSQDTCKNMMMWI